MWYPTRGYGGVAGVYAPAFVERVMEHVAEEIKAGGVAGVYAPAFVEHGYGLRSRPWVQMFEHKYFYFI